MFNITETITWAITKFWTVLKIVGGAIVGRIMASMGLSWLAYHAVLPDVKSFLVERISILPPTAQAFIGAVGFDVFMVMILSALVVKLGSRAILSTSAAAVGASLPQ